MAAALLAASFVATDVASACCFDGLFCRCGRPLRLRIKMLCALLCAVLGAALLYAVLRAALLRAVLRPELLRALRADVLGADAHAARVCAGRTDGHAAGNGGAGSGDDAAGRPPLDGAAVVGNAACGSLCNPADSDTDSNAAGCQAAGGKGCRKAGSETSREAGGEARREAGGEARSGARGSAAEEHGAPEAGRSGSSGRSRCPGCPGCPRRSGRSGCPGCPGQSCRSGCPG